MEIAINLWQTFGKLSQSVLAVLAAFILYWLFRTISLTRIEKAAAATSNDLDDRMVQFVKQFLWIVAILFTVAIVLKINSIKINVHVKCFCKKKQ